MKDLTTSSIDRQNVLNNTTAIKHIQEFMGISGLFYNDMYYFTNKMVADFFQVTTRTIRNIIQKYEEEIGHNGYQVIKGKKLKEFKDMFGPLLTAEDVAPQKETDFPLSNQVDDSQSFKRLKSLALFDFRAFLNVGMLLTESEQAKQMRSVILDITIDVLNKKMGGETKYINQRDEEFLIAAVREPIYRKEFTDALNLCLEMGNYKYAVYTDAIYKAIFKENAKEYKAILKLQEEDNPRETMYAEVLKVIASFEIGIADEMKEQSKMLGRKLRPNELNILIDKFSKKRMWIPQIEDARNKMASRDYGLRDIVHHRLKDYIEALSKDDYERFLGEKSKSLIERIVEDPELLAVYKRLKDR